MHDAKHLDSDPPNLFRHDAHHALLVSLELHLHHRWRGLGLRTGRRSFLPDWDDIRWGSMRQTGRSTGKGRSACNDHEEFLHTSSAPMNIRNNAGQGSLPRRLSQGMFGEGRQGRPGGWRSLSLRPGLVTGDLWSSYFGAQTLLTSSKPGGHRRFAEASGTAVKRPRPRIDRAMTAATTFFILHISSSVVMG